MAKSLLLKEFNSLVLTRDDKYSIQNYLSVIASKVMMSYKRKQCKRAGIPFNPSPKLGKANVQAMRRLYLETFEKSLALNKIVAYKFISDQKQREKRRTEREESLKRREEEEKLVLQKLEQEKILRKEQEKNEKIRSLQELAEKRKNEMNRLKHLQSPVMYPPLFKQIEENYYLKQQMPELERRKKELETKRDMFKPISLSEIRQHAENSKKMLEAVQIRKKTQSCQFQDNNFHKMRSNFTKLVLDQDKKLKQEPDLQKRAKKILSEKKKKYSKIVGELYQPSIDKFKEQEMKLIKARLDFPFKFKIRDSFNTECSSNCSRSLSVQHKKWKKNSMIPDPPIQRVGKEVFYLEEQRKKRTEHSPQIKKTELDWENKLIKIKDLDEKQSYLKKKSRILDSQAQSLERYLNKKSFDLNIADHVNDLLINSIRAKLSYLE